MYISKRIQFRPTRRGWMLIAVVGVMLSSLTADAVASAGRIRAGVEIGPLDVGGRPIEEAELLLTKHAKLLATRPASFTAQGQTVTVTPEAVGFFPDVDSTIEKARRVGREGNLVAKVWQRFRTYFASSDVGWRSEIDRRSAKKIVDGWAARFDHPGHEAGIRAENGKIVAEAPLPGRKLDRARAATAIKRGLESWPRTPIRLPFVTKGRRTDMRDAESAAERANELVRAPVTLSSPAGTLDLQPAELASMLEAVPRKRFGRWGLQLRFSPALVTRDLGARMIQFERAPRDASFTVSGATVDVLPGQDGLKFDADKTAEALDAIADNDPPRTTDAAFTVEHPKLTDDEAKALKIKELVSSFTTRHPAGQPRVKNIHIIADRIDGTIVRSGEVFSLNKAAGERTAEKGYVMAPMIFDGEFKDQIGGGVSQFATTIFNAVYEGGYEYVSYKAHSYYISRYPAGRDATVSWPAPDFKFRNNSGAGILIKTAYSGSTITVSFYGDKEGKRVTSESEPRTNPKTFTEKREPDPTLAPGTEKEKQKGMDGFDIVVWRIITVDGKTKRQKFFTRYLPEPRIILVGPGGPSPTPSSQPAPGQTTPAPSTPAPLTPRPPRTPEPTATPRGPL